VASFGENLRQARMARNISLQEIAVTTKISSRALQALEDEHFDLLPGGIFNKGFVRAYARCVGLDEEKAIADYLAAAKVSPSEIDMEVMSTQVTAAAGTRQPWAPSATSVVGVVAVLVALGMGALWLNEQRKEARDVTAARQVTEKPAAPVPPAQSTVPTSEPNPSPQGVANSGQSNANQVPTNTNQEAAANAAASTPALSVVPTSVAPKQQAPVEVSISATARVWISVRSDGKAVETLTLDPDKPENRSRSYTAKEKLLLVVGNPAGLSVTYNGKPTGVLGAVGKREMITFTPQGMEKQ
jgi:cytoskeleton protein RodZ